PGIGFAVTGALLRTGRAAAVGRYALLLFASTVWSLWELGLDWRHLLPRLALWFALGIVLLLTLFRKPLLRNGPARMGTA
ncbi:hypothetical protein, partial [Pseudomonas syringae group genomosp. 7]|uniref:hypothetical protein n=1 Tax=Pseudomonas syringae group genomosp. 7 TaxID=251699 RepID=UPI00376F9D52